MRKQISLKKNFIMNAILTLSSFIFPLITFPYVSRILLPVGTGRVSFATSVIAYFNMFAQLGIPTYGIRACARVRDNKEELTRTTHELLMINVIMSIFMYIVLAAALAFIPRLRADRLLFIIVCASIFLNAIGMEYLYRGLEQYTYITVRSIIFKFIALAAMFLLVHQKSDYIIYGGISIFAASASNIMNFINARKYIYMHPVGGYNMRRHFKAVGIFFAMSVATTVYTNLDTIMLGFMTTDDDVGYYNTAVKIKVILVGIVTSLGGVLLPRSSYYVENGQMDEFRRLSRKALRFVWLLAAPLALYFILFSAQGIYFLSGPAFKGSILPMQWIMPTVLFIGLTNITGIQILVPLGREKYVLYSEIGGAVTDLIINALLIPHFKSTGASIGTLAAEFVVLLIQCIALKDTAKKLFSSLPYLESILGLALASLGSVWAVWLHFVENLTLNSFLILIISAVCFFGIYIIVLVLFKEPLLKEMAQTAVGKLKAKTGGS